jgi:hypothetical protein
MCPTCGQVAQSMGGIGCVCRACYRCGAGIDPQRLCFMCRGCKNCGRSFMMHTEGQMKSCKESRDSK